MHVNSLIYLKNILKFVSIPQCCRSERVGGVVAFSPTFRAIRLWRSCSPCGATIQLSYRCALEKDLFLIAATAKVVAHSNCRTRRLNSLSKGRLDKNLWPSASNPIAVVQPKIISIESNLPTEAIFAK